MIRSDRERRSAGRRRRAWLGLEDLEGRRVPTLSLAGGLASTLAPTAVVSASAPGSTVSPDLTPPPPGPITPRPGPSNPPPFSLLSATAVSSDEVDLTWTAAPGATSATTYKVGFSPNPEIPNEFFTAPTSGTTDQLTNLAYDTTYSFTVFATNLSTGVGWTNTLHATTFPVWPVLTAKAVSTTEVDLSWYDVDAGVHYSVRDSTDGGTTWTTLPAPTGTTDAIAGLSPGTNYTFEVGASIAGGTTYSSPETVITFPAAPTVVARPVSATEVDLSWGAVTGATGYSVEDSSNGGVSWTTLPAPSGTTDPVLNLAPNTSYLFEVAASDASGTTSSPPASALTFPGAPSFTITATSKTELDLAWPAVPGGPCSYQVYYVDDDGSALELTIPNNPGATGYVEKLTNLDPQTVYSISMGAMNASGETWSGYETATTTLAAPVLTSAAPRSATEVDLSWTPVRGATGYTIRATNEDSPGQSLLIPGVGTGAAITGLNPGTSYSFAVEASNAAVTSGWSNALGATTFPSAPAVTIAPVSATEIDLGWPAAFGASGYTVQESTNGGASWTTLPAPSGTSDRVTGLSPATSYSFKVAAYDAGGATSSGVLDATTFPAAPIVTARVASGSEVDLSWAPVAGATDGYQVDEVAANGALTSLGSIQGTSDPVTGLSPDTAYSFEVGASNGSGTTFSGAVRATTLAGLPATLTVQLSTTTIAAGGSVGSVTIKALDASGKPSANVNLQVTTNAGQTWPVAIVDGTGTIPGPIAYTKSETVTFTASYGSVKGTANLTVTPGSPATIKVGSFATSLVVGQAASVTVTVVDKYGNPIGDQLITGGSGGSLAAASVKANGDGQATVVITANHSGNVNGVKASVTLSAGSATATVSTTVYPSIYTLNATVTAYFYVDDDEDDTATFTQTFTGTGNSAAACVASIQQQEDDWFDQLEEDDDDYYGGISDITQGNLQAGN